MLPIEDSHTGLMRELEIKHDQIHQWHCTATEIQLQQFLTQSQPAVASRKWWAYYLGVSLSSLGHLNNSFGDQFGCKMP